MLNVCVLRAKVYTGQCAECHLLQLCMVRLLPDCSLVRCYLGFHEHPERVQCFQPFHLIRVMMGKHCELLIHVKLVIGGDRLDGIADRPVYLKSVLALDANLLWSGSPC